MNRYRSLAALAFLCLGLSGCDTYTAATYGVSMNNDAVLKKLGPASVNVGSFSGPANPSMLCRMVGPIHLPGDISPQDYVSQALSAELQIAGLAGGTKSGVTLTGQITDFGFNSMIGDGYWQLGLGVSSSNGKSLAINNRYDFASSFTGDAACHNVADAFEPAVQALMTKLVSDPTFPDLLKN